MVKKLVIALVILLSLSFNGQAQQPYVELILSAEKVVPNETFTITVKSNVEGDLNIEFPKSFEHGNSVMNRVEQEIDGTTGRVMTFLYYSRTGSFREAGTYTLGPAYVRKGRKVYHSNKVNITVLSQEEKQRISAEVAVSNRVISGKILPSKKTYYVGEPIVLKAKVYSKFNPTHYEAYESYKTSPSLENHSIDKNANVRVEIENCGKQPRYVFVHDKKVFFTHKPGVVHLEPFELILLSGFDSYPLTSEKNSVVVKSLPSGAPVGFHGAVGKFNLETQSKTRQASVGDVVPFMVTLSGHGNLQNTRIKLPDLSGNFQLYGDPEITEKIKYSDKGAEGSVNYTFYLKCLKSGEMNAPAIEFVYFDPTQVKYITLENEPEQWSIRESGQQIDGTDKETLVLEHFKNEEEPYEKSNKWLMAATLGASISVLGFLFLLGFKKRKASNNQDENFDELTVDEEKIKIHEENIIPTIPHFSKEINFLRMHLDDESEVEFYTAAKKLLDKIAQFDLNENQNAELKPLIRACESFIYGGLPYSEGKLAILNKIESIIEGLRK